MTVQKNKELIRCYAEDVYNKHNLDVLLDFVGGELAENGGDHLQQFFTAFPDTEATILDLFGEGDKIVARLLINGRHKGSLPANLQPGKRYSFTQSEFTA